MIAREIAPGVLCLAAVHWDRKLFDELVPLPDGTSYNSYLVRGSEKTALIDTAYPPKTEAFLAALRRTGVERIDYVIANHGEQDHSGSIPAILAAYPGAKVVTNNKCKGLIADALDIADDAFMTVQEGNTLSLGDKTLRFMMTPWVHWPDTMVTTLPEDGIVFTCDFMGAHLASSDLFATDEPRVEVAAKRYYAEIMMPFRPSVKKHVERIAALDPRIIAPSHGPVHNRPAFILDLHRRWAGDAVRPEVVVPFVSMYESTATMAEYLVDRLMEAGLAVHLQNVVGGDAGELAMNLVEASTIVFASPTVLVGPHPAIAYVAYLANALKPKARFASVIGSYGWGSQMPDRLMEMLPALSLQYLDPVMARGRPGKAEFEALDRLAAEIVKANQQASADAKA